LYYTTKEAINIFDHDLMKKLVEIGKPGKK